MGQQGPTGGPPPVWHPPGAQRLRQARSPARLHARWRRGAEQADSRHELRLDCMGATRRGGRLVPLSACARGAPRGARVRPLHPARQTGPAGAACARRRARSRWRPARGRRCCATRRRRGRARRAAPAGPARRSRPRQRRTQPGQRRGGPWCWMCATRTSGTRGTLRARSARWRYAPPGPLCKCPRHGRLEVHQGARLL